MRRLVAALLLAGIGGACGGAASDKRVVLTFWAFGREGEMVAELTRDFERTHPNVRVVVQQIPWRAAHEKLLTAFVGETLPDIAQLGNTWIAEFAALGALTPLDSLLAQSGALRAESFFPGIWATNVVDSVVYGIPWYVDTRVLFYRSDLLANAGVKTVPRTWDEWRDAMRKVRALSSGAAYAIYLPVNEWTQPVILGLQTGSRLLADNGTRGAFRDSTFRRAFDFYISIFRDTLAPVLGSSQIANRYQEFARGTFAMYISGPWDLTEFATRLPAELQTSWATAPLPGPTADDPGVSLAGGSSLVLTAGSRYQREAWELLEFLSEPAQQAKFYRLSGDLPPTTAAWQDSSLAGNPRAQAFFQQLQHVRPLPTVPEMEQIAIRVQELAEAAIRGVRSKDDALTTLDHDVDQMLEKRRWMLDHATVARGKR
ncbi:MAG: sugar ABC transporter substrate-binding protein [Gemmatimonadaceae bacterium]